VHTELATSESESRPRLPQISDAQGEEAEEEGRKWAARLEIREVFGQLPVSELGDPANRQQQGSLQQSARRGRAEKHP